MNWWKPFKAQPKSESEKSSITSVFGREVNPRRYPRIYLLSENQPLAQLFGAEALWKDGRVSKVYDLSQSGTAFLKDDVPPLAVGDRGEFRLSLSGVGSFDVKGDVARVSERVVAFDFEELGADVHLGLAKYLESKMIGLSLRPVDPKFYVSLEQGFTHWFQGPNETNVFLRIDDLSLVAAQVTMGDDVLEWRENALGGEFRTSSVSHANVETKDSQVLSRVLEMLSQVRESKATLDPLVRALLGAQPVGAQPR